MLVLAVTLSGLSGCVARQNHAADQYRWYVGQGANVTDCGPAVAAMAVRWSGGESDVNTARAITQSTGFWNMRTIALHLLQHGRAFEWSQSIESSLRQHPERALVVRLHNKIIGHFVLVYALRGKQVRVADPLFGVSWQHLKWVESLRGHEWMIQIVRPAGGLQ